MYDGDECIGINELLEAFSETEEETIFETKIVEDLYEH